MSSSDNNGKGDELSLELEDLEIEGIVASELNEETKGHPEGLASCYFCCTSASLPV